VLRIVLQTMSVGQLSLCIRHAITYSSSSTVSIRRGSIDVAASVWVRRGSICITTLGGMGVTTILLVGSLRHGECWAQRGDDRVQACVSDSCSGASRQMRKLRKDALTVHNADCAAHQRRLAM
jgi:hypothetical protein